MTTMSHSETGPAGRDGRAGVTGRLAGRGAELGAAGGGLVAARGQNRGEVTWWSDLGGDFGGDETGVAEHDPGALGGAVAGDQVVAAGSQRADRAEVALALGGGVGGEAEHRTPQGPDPDGGGDHEDPAHRGEQAEQDADQQADPGAAEGACGGGPGLGQPAGHPLDQVQVAAHDVQRLDREAVVGQLVHRALGGGVVVESRHRVPGGEGRGHQHRRSLGQHRASFLSDRVSPGTPSPSAAGVQNQRVTSGDRMKNLTERSSVRQRGRGPVILVPMRGSRRPGARWVPGAVTIAALATMTAGGGGSGVPSAPAGSDGAGPSAGPAVSVRVPAGLGGGAFSARRTLHLPKGWTVSVWARVSNARIEAWSPQGELLVSQPSRGTVTELRPGQHDTATGHTILSGLTTPQGLAFAKLNGREVLYVGESDQIDRYPWGGHGISGPRTVVARDLPDQDASGDDVHRDKDVAVTADGTVFF